MESNELKIKESARKLFLKKGFDAVKTREIAEDAGINSALLHYYFRSKEKLFRIIMVESYNEIFSSIRNCINDTETSLSEKIEIMVNVILDKIQTNPNLVIFVFNELHNNPDFLFTELSIPQQLLRESHLYVQMEEHLQKKSIDIQPYHFILNLISLTVMPLAASPMLKYLYYPDITDINNFLTDRRKLIPLWIKQTLKIED